MSRVTSQKGFSLVELMVAMTIALVAMLAGSSMYLSTKQTNRVQQMQDVLTQDGRFAMYMLQQIISQAGFRDNPGNAIGGDYITPNASSETVSVRFFGDGISAIDCSGALVNGQNTLTIAKNGSSLQCSPQGGSASQTQNWIASTGSGTEVVSFRVQYGTDTTPPGGATQIAASVGCGADVGTGFKARDCVADTYDAATAIANPAQVVAVKVCLVLRTNRTDSSLSAKSAVKDCAGTVISGSDSDQRLYRTFRTTIQLRNY